MVREYKALKIRGDCYGETHLSRSNDHQTLGLFNIISYDATLRKAFGLTS
jgi:hypothetical protein